MPSYEKFLLYNKPRKDGLLMYSHFYPMWFTKLNRWNVSLFNWKNIPCSSWDIELYLTVTGYCGATKAGKELLVVDGGMSGSTNYPTKFMEFTWTTPLNNGMFTIGKDGELCKNNRVMETDVFDLQSYAHILAHVDLSIQAYLINHRSDFILSTANQAQADTANSWLKAFRLGKTNALIDANDFESLIENKGISVLPTATQPHGKLTELYNLRCDILRDFFNERGFLSDKSKTERLVAAEVDVNLPRAMFSVSDKLEERKDFCERVNKMFGTNWSVEYNTWLTKQETEVEDNADSTDSQGNAERPTDNNGE